MENFNFLLTNNYMSTITYILKIFFISICSYYTYLRVINQKKFINLKLIILFAVTFVISIVCGYLKYKYDSFSSTLFMVFTLSSLYSFITKNKFGHSILITIISLSINYVLFFISISITFIINILFTITNEYINLLIMMIIHFLILSFSFKLRKLKNGFSFIYKKIKNEYFDLLILNISVSILFCVVSINNVVNNFNVFITSNMILSLLIFSTIAFITIQKSFTMYYKHKLLVAELNDTKSELEKKNREIAELEAENLEYSKTAHSIAHKQKSLEHKLNELMSKTEFAEELDIRDRLDDISKECFENNAVPPLPKTEIEIIDDMISCMRSECKNNNIDFELQLNGNIHHMINNFVSKEELEIFLADHIKDAIIAINYSDNVNKSILVKLGLFDGNYLLNIYDSGIEFEIETLLDLGLKPSTTHSDNGGTGMGFMNTFDTLRKHSASLYINEIGKPTKENYTKSVTICFNNKNEYKITSYRANEIKEKNTRTDLIVE